MVNVVPVVTQSDSDNPVMRCNCGHQFYRSGLDIIKKVYIPEWDGRLEDFDIERFVTVRSECQVCSCCSEEDEEIQEVSGVSGYLCGGCGTLHDDEDDALACCEDG